MRLAVESGYIARSPCIGVKLPKMEQREMLFLTGEEVERLAGQMIEPYGVLVFVLAYCGLRWGEAAALRRRRCDLLHSRIEVRESLAEVNGELHFGPTKTYAARSLAIPRFLQDLLAQHLSEHVAAAPEAYI